MNAPISIPYPKIEKPKASRTPPRLLNVVEIIDVSPSLRRIRLSGDNLLGFPADKNGSHIKVFIPRAGQNAPQLPWLENNTILWPPADQKPITRTYSVRHYCPVQNILDVEFVLHGAHSPASGWAQAAKLGDQIGIAGPGGPDPLLAPADWHFCMGDLTALPAISALLENMPANAQGHVLIHIENASEKFSLAAPQGVAVQWLVTPISHAKAKLLAAFTALNIPAKGSRSAFVAGENGCVVALREALRARLGLTKASLYAVPYWRHGQDEETYHQERHRIMDEVY
ncbi:MAG: siderophore-interacting protein [Marinagarivorans sp.]|nr:siderophore-interacting protein [Marinagarivorans sp.]